MKYFTILLIFLGSLNHLTAQIQIGSIWHYRQWNPTWGNLVPKTLSLTDTATIDGKLGYKVEGDCGTEPNGDYLAQENGILYWHLDTLGWFKLYNFNLDVGDRDTCYLGKKTPWLNYEYLAYIVDSVSWTTTLSGSPVKVLHLIYESSGCDWAKNKIYVNYGSDECLFPLCGLHSAGWRSFLCYEVNGVTEFSPSGETCEIILPTGELADEKKALFTIHPNPIGDVLYLQVSEILTQTQHFKFTMYDFMGRLFFEKIMEKSASQWQFSLENLPKGLYFYKITEVSTKGRVLQSGKLVRM